MADKLVFDASIEGLYVRALAGRITPELKAELRTLGLDLGKKLPPAIDRDLWYRCIDVTAKHLFPDRPLDAAHREMGKRLIEGLEHTLLGKALAPVVRMLGVKRVLRRVPHNMKTANNFATAKLTELDEHSVAFDVDDIGTAPGLMTGSLEGVVLWAGGRTVEVDARVTTPPAARFVVRWTQ